jgi:hypothetical protein
LLAGVSTVPGEQNHAFAPEQPFLVTFNIVLFRYYNSFNPQKPTVEYTKIRQGYQSLYCSFRLLVVTIYEYSAQGKLSRRYTMDAPTRTR